MSRWLLCLIGLHDIGRATWMPKNDDRRRHFICGDCRRWFTRSSK